MFNTVYNSGIIQLSFLLFIPCFLCLTIPEPDKNEPVANLRYFHIWVGYGIVDTQNTTIRQSMPICHNYNVPCVTIRGIENMATCVFRCIQLGSRCRGFGFKKYACFLYEYPRASYLTSCKLQDSYPYSFYTEIGYYPHTTNIVKVENAAQFKPTQMSTIYVWHQWNRRDITIVQSGEYAVDVYKTTEFYKLYDTDLKCAITSPSVFSWWRVDLLSVFVVIEVTLTNTAAREYNVLHDLEVRVGHVDIAIMTREEKYLPFTKNNLCDELPEMGLRNVTANLVCKQPLDGRYVSVQIVHPCSPGICPYGDYLVLCEVEVWGYLLNPAVGRRNVALLQPVKLNADALKFEPGYRAVDGFTIAGKTFQLASGEVTEKFPYLQIDLWHQYLIDEIVLLSSVPPWNAHNREFEIRVGNAEILGIDTLFKDGQVCGSSTNTFHYFQPLRYKCSPPRYGRRVTYQIQKPCDYCPKSYEKNRIVLSEVWVYGILLDFHPYDTAIAQHKPALQSSVWNDKTVAELAVDGDTTIPESWKGSQCIKTHANDRLPWWRVDLEQAYHVISVDLFTLPAGKLGAIHDFEIRVGMADIHVFNPFVRFHANEVCYRALADDKDRVAGGRQRYYCKYPVQGQFVSIQVVRFCSVMDVCVSTDFNILFLCEVMIHGYQVEYYTHSFGRIANETYWKKLSEGKLPMLDIIATRQSSNWFPEANATLATDNDYSLHFKVESNYKCSHSNPQPGVDPVPWWQIDLGQMCHVRKIAIYNRGEQNEWRLKDFQVRVGNVDISPMPPGNVFGSNELCSYANKQTFGQGWIHLMCPPYVTGQYLSIQMIEECSESTCIYDTNNYLTMCEVFVWGIFAANAPPTRMTNVALLKPVEVSPSSGYNNKLTHLLVDGLVSCVNDLINWFCIYNKVENDTNPWVMIDLQTLHDVTGVAFTSKVPDKNEEIEIRVGIEDVSKTLPKERIAINEVCYKSVLPDLKTDTTIACTKHLTGQYISIQMITAIEFSEIRVWGLKKNIDTPEGGDGGSSNPDITGGYENLVIYQPTAQSSYAITPFFAVDGLQYNATNPGPQCAQTVAETLPWWRVHLGQSCLVERVVISNKGNNKGRNPDETPVLAIRVGNVDVCNSGGNGLNEEFLANQLCGNIKGTTEKAVVVCPKPLLGQYVSVQLIVQCSDKSECNLWRQTLILCEVRVFGNLSITVDVEEEQELSDRPVWKPVSVKKSA